MWKLEIIWKKAEKVQAEAIVSKFEINGKDKKNSSMKEGKFDSSFCSYQDSFGTKAIHL